MNSAFTFKVNTRGVLLNLNPEVKFEILKEELKNHVNGASTFFAGVDLYLNIDGCCFQADQVREIMDIISGYQDVNNIYFTSKGSSSKNENRYKRDTVLIKGTLRSGQKIKYPTNIVILGDVNPGAEVIAGGDVIILGKLRGVVHAGARGMVEAQVIAFKLQPTQVRIAGYISRSPEEGISSEKLFKPERAYVKDSAIVVEELSI